MRFGAQLQQAIGQPKALARLGIASRPQWSPANLGPSLLAFWDAELASSLTLAGSNVTTWADRVAGYAPTQSTGGSKPVYSATSFNNRPGVTFDGVDDYLELAGVPAAIPTGATACEIWALIDQAALVADTTLRTPIGWGSSNPTNRVIRRAVTTGVNRTQALIGDGVAATTVADANVDLSGKHVVRLQVGATQTSLSVDGAAATTASVVPSTASTRLRIGSTPGTSPAAFWTGAINAALVTNPLSASDAALMLAYLKTRGGIA